MQESLEELETQELDAGNCTVWRLPVGTKLMHFVKDKEVSVATSLPCPLPPLFLSVSLATSLVSLATSLPLSLLFLKHLWVEEWGIALRGIAFGRGGRQSWPFSCSLQCLSHAACNAVLMQPAMPWQRVQQLKLVRQQVLKDCVDKCNGLVVMLGKHLADSKATLVQLEQEVVLESRSNLDEEHRVRQTIDDSLLGMDAPQDDMKGFEKFASMQVAHLEGVLTPPMPPTPAVDQGSHINWGEVYAYQSVYQSVYPSVYQSHINWAEV